MRKVHDDQVLERNLNKREIAQFKKWGFGPKKPLAFQNVVEAFQKNAAKFPNDIALEHEGRQLTYLELDQYSEQVAGILRLQTVNAQENVGLFLERSIEMVIGMLAILKVGAAYVPQDIRLSPMNLLDSIGEDAEIDTVL